ncbi:Cacna1h, partial [Symbiodinium pilosum]
FQNAFETKEVATKLKLLGFKEDDCQVIFNLLDEGDGSLTIDEFFEGLQEMKGPAQAKQCFMIRKRVEQIWNLLIQFSHEVDQDLMDISTGSK